MASRVHNWQEKALVGAFIGGLKIELAAEVGVHRPKSYADAVDIARLREDHLQAAKKQPQMNVRRLGPIIPEGRSSRITY